MLRPCYYCGWLPSSYERLARHLTNNHSDKGFVMSMFYPSAVYCLCRDAPFALQDPSVGQSLAEHLKECGGLDAHLAAIALGLVETRRLG